MRKGELIALLLAGLLGSPRAAELLFWNFIEGKYRNPRGSWVKSATRWKARREWDASTRTEWIRYRSLLTHLKNDGLIEIQGKTVRLKSAGKLRLKQLRKTFRNRLPEPFYHAETCDRWTLLAFDIPETERAKRDWLRCALRHMNFSLLQKSLWGARRKLPSAFVTALHQHGMAGYVDVFSISKIGTLRRIDLRS